MTIQPITEFQLYITSANKCKYMAQQVLLFFTESVVQFRSVAQLCLTLCDPINQACQASLSITNSWSLLKLMSIKLVMPSNHLILCHLLLLLPLITTSTRVFPNESVLCIRWQKYFLPRSKRLLISWLQSPSAVILKPPKIKSVTVFVVFPSICYEVMGPDAMILVF